LWNLLASHFKGAFSVGGWWTAAIAFAVLGVALQLRVGHLWAGSSLKDQATFALAPKISGWELIPSQGAAPPETDGRVSHFWLYHNGHMTAAIAMDYPFSGFHDAAICYRLSGWNTDSKQLILPGQHLPAQPMRKGYFELGMTKAPLARARMLFSQVDEQGNVVPEPQGPPAGADRLQTNLYLSRQTALSPASYQIELLSVGYAPLTPAEEAKLRSLYQGARAELVKQLVAQTENKR
jgi:hypothetical protein